MSYFDDLEFKPLDLNFGPARLARADTHPDKLDLSLGVYRSEEGKPMMFDVVREVREKHSTDPNQLEEYLPLLGNPDLSNDSRDLLFKTQDTDEEEYAKLCNRVCSLHTASATNAIFLGLYMLKNNVKGATRAHTSNPCWVGYPTIVKNTGLEYLEHPYINKADSSLDLDGMLEYFETLREADIVLLQVSAHNPCGVDPSNEQWKAIAKVCKRKGLIPFLDIAYQGYATGDLEEDSYPVRLFAEMEMEYLISHSFSKMLTVYAGRVGCLHMVLAKEDPELREKVISNLRHMSRAMYGTPVRLYSEIVHIVLNTPSYRKRWRQELYSAFSRIKGVRETLYRKLLEYKVPGTWEHVINQRGMFCFLNIPEVKVHQLREKHHIYLIFNSRVCVAQLNDRRAEMLARALKDVLEND